MELPPPRNTWFSALRRAAVVAAFFLRHDRSKYVRRILAVKVESMANIARGGVVYRRVVNRSFAAH